jgi:MFS family permease
MHDARLTRNQIRGFWASWAGWTVDGMDSFIYALVMVPSLRELLPKSHIAATRANVSYYGGILFALFLIGWGFAFLWGPLADKFGRVRTLMLTILWYSLFTFLGALATGVWQLAAYRLLAGIGIGGEWAMGGTFVAEEWPEERRKMGAGMMHTGYYAGVFLAALANYGIGGHYGWRAMFALGALPALFIGFIRYGITEPQRWEAKSNQLKRQSVWRPLAQLFSRDYRRRTVLNSIYMFVSIVGLWAGSVYVPASITYIAAREHFASVQAVRFASYGTMLLAIATILGCLMVPALAERFGRRVTMALFFGCMFVFILLAFGYVFYLSVHALPWFFVCLFFLGLGGANFAVYTLWLPEQYPTECRASAFVFSTSAARFAGAGITFLVGAGVAHFHTIGIPIAITSTAFIVGLALLPLGVETKGSGLPA